MASTDKLTPDDPRVTHEYATLNGVRYHYLHASPPNPKATIFLIHGWPDFSFGWRYQIPYLLALNYRVVAPDMIGYARTEAPTDLAFYTFKRAAADLAALAAHLDVPRFILLGHDWGGAIVYRVALWQPQLVQAVVAVCTPYSRPSTTFVSTETLVAGPLPQFAYQLALASGSVEREIRTERDIAHFVNALYGARTPDGKVGFDARVGPLFDVIKSGALTRSNLLAQEEWEHYAREYARTGMRGTVNWYRTRELNHADELPLAQRGDALKIAAPTLFVGASRDVALPPRMSRGMEQHFVELKRCEVDGGHWILVQKAAECNRIIGEYLDDIVARDSKSNKGGAKI